MQPILLNLGGCGDCHPRKGYEGFVSADIRAPRKGLWAHHNILEAVPLPSGSVSRIHTEELLQFLALPDIERLLMECHRLLIPGGRLRIACCDYNHPKDVRYLKDGRSPHSEQVTLLHYELMKQILDRSPFGSYTFLHYWKDGKFVEHPIDYSLGYIRRTPEHDKRNWYTSPKGRWRNFLFRLSKGFVLAPEERVCLRGYPYHITSLVVDCMKEISM